MELGFKKQKVIWILLFLISIYLVLAYKNPFSYNSLIPNLEPYPDTLLYTLPAWNWAKGNGFVMSVENIIVKHTISMTYSYYLAPFMKLFNDVRGFYYANILSGVLTIIFFTFWLKNIFISSKYINWLILFLGFLLVTNFYFFNQAVLPMAENLNFLLICLFFYWQSKKIDTKNIFISFLIVFLVGSVKTTNLVIAGVFSLIVFFRIIYEIFWPSKKLRKWVFWMGFILVFLGLFFYLPRILKFNTVSFNISYFEKNWAFYWNCLKGGPTRNLWYFQKTLTTDIFLMAILGLIFGSFSKKYRFIVLSIWSTVVVFVTAMSFFRDSEARHVMVFIPLFLVLYGIGLDIVLNKFNEYWIYVLSGLLILNLILAYEPTGKLPKIISLKQQVGMNFRHRETPWNYVCIDKFNSYFKNSDKNTYFGSFLPIYLFYMYGGNNYSHLPLSSGQDFMSRDMGKYFLLPLKNEYLNKLEQGKLIYYSDYYSSNGREGWKNELKDLTEGLKVIKVYQDSDDVCNIYQIFNSKNDK